MCELSYAQRVNVIANTLSVIRFLNPHRLDIRKLANPIRTKFPAMSRMLYTTEWQTGIGRNHAVDEDHPCFDFIDEALALMLVVRPGAGSQPEAAVIGDGNCLINILGVKYGRHF